MSEPDQVIVLAAGRGNQADGMAKCLIRHPTDGLSVLDHILSVFSGRRVIVVVGFRAIQVMDHYPQLDFVINEHWSDTNNAMSLGLALDNRPTYVVPGDVFIQGDLIEYLDGLGPDVALVCHHENRIPSAIHAVVGEGGSIASAYQGAIQDMANPELLGMFKISTPEVLQEWRQRCVRNSHWFAGMALPFNLSPILPADVGTHRYDEVNTPADYWRLIQATRNKDD